jgi:hypothetical protein
MLLHLTGCVPLTTPFAILRHLLQPLLQTLTRDQHTSSTPPASPNIDFQTPFPP